jgi:hypothetical protein
MKIYPVPNSLVSDLWSAVAPLLDMALERHPFLDSEGLRQSLLADFSSLSIMTEDGEVITALVMERVRYPVNRMVANVLAIGGRGVFKHGDEISAYLEEWARAHQCDTISFIGRPGWTRAALGKGGQVMPLALGWKHVDLKTNV